MHSSPRRPRADPRAGGRRFGAHLLGNRQGSGCRRGRGSGQGSHQVQQGPSHRGAEDILYLPNISTYLHVYLHVRETRLLALDMMEFRRNNKNMDSASQQQLGPRPHLHGEV